MPAVDFTEIAPANSGDGNQDTFELFARDFFSALGLEVVEGPSRGADGGRDLIAFEALSGKVINTTHKWLISCKHYAHSKRAVGGSDEVNVYDRVQKFNADGFMAFYSTLPSSGLEDTLRSYEDRMAIAVWDNEKIEAALIQEISLQPVFARYFPNSYQSWKRRDKAPTKVFGTYTPLACVTCGRDLLLDRRGNITIVTKFQDNPDKIYDVFWACYGNCDRRAERKYKDVIWLTRWVSLDELTVPMRYMQWIGSHLTRTRDGEQTFTDEAFEKFRFVMMCTSQVVVRETTPDQWEKLQRLTMLPSYLGGLG